MAFKNQIKTAKTLNKNQNYKPKFAQICVSWEEFP